MADNHVTKNYHDQGGDRYVVGGELQIVDGGKVTDSDGNEISLGGGSYTLPAATTSVIGGVKQAAVTPQVAADDATAAAGDTPTKAEYDAVVTLVNELKAKVNSLINNGRSAGQQASS